LTSNRVWAFIWVFIFFLFQNFLNYLLPEKCPFLLLIVVIFYSLREGPVFGMLLGAAAGFLLELFTQGRFGFWIVDLGILGVLSGYISSKIFQDSLLTGIFLPAIAFYFSTLAEIFFLQSQTWQFAEWEAVAGAFMLWPLLGTAVISPVMFAWLQKFWSAQDSSRLRNVYR
jgi:hypothetical protein